jgi:hypothetical protein
VTSILFDHETGCIRKFISLSFHAYEECSNRRSYLPCALILRYGGPGLRIENKHEK